MKKFVTTFAFIAAAAMIFSSCEKETITPSESENSITLHINAASVDTKSSFGAKEDGAYPVIWSTNKDVVFSLDEADFVAATPTLVNDGKNASFVVTFDGATSPQTVYAFSPKGVYDSKDATKCIPGFTGISREHHDVYINIPSAQTPLANSCDESAQALYASQPYTGSEIDMTFSHAVAYGKMQIKNFEGTISKVDLVFPVDVCGSSCYFYYSGDNAGTISNLNGKTISLNPSNVVDNLFWFALAPTAGDTGSLKIIVTDSDDKTYTKTIDLTAKALPFIKGQVSTFGVNMSGIAADENEPVIPDGDYAILAKDGDDYYAVSVNANGTSTRRDRVVVNYNGGISFETSNKDLIWTFTASTDTYTIANGTDYMGATKNAIPLKSETDAAHVSIVKNVDGTYTLTAVCGNDDTRYMAMNGSYGFGWYASTTGVNNLYIVPATHAAPTKYKINVNATTNGTVIASKDEAEAGETITITVTPDTGYQLDALTYNGNDIKESKSFVMPAENVTISASFIQSEGTGELNTWTYEVVQTSPTLSASSTAEVEGATWSIVMGDKVGSPTTNGAPTKYSGIYGWKWGDSGSKYWKSYTLSTDYFASKKVKSVTVNILNNGTKTGTMTVMQGSTIIGTASANFGTNWTNLTANTTQGTSGTLTIEYTVAQASYLHSITIEYYD